MSRKKPLLFKDSVRGRQLHVGRFRGNTLHTNNGLVRT